MLPGLCAQVGSEVVARILVTDNGTLMLKIASLAACFAALDRSLEAPARALVRFGSLGGWLGGMMRGLL